MNTATDTDHTVRPTADFTSTGRRVIIGTPSTGRVAHVYAASDDAKMWDGVDSDHGVGSRHGGYCWCDIEITGRKDRYFPGYTEAVRKGRIRFTGADDTGEWSECWVIGGGDSF